jgi:hypothetical protein
MQAIQTKFLPATNTRGARIKATCWRGSITIDYPHHLSGDEVHREAARALLAKFRAEDKEKYGSEDSGAWGWEFVTGTLPDGSCCHVLISPYAERGEG